LSRDSLLYKITIRELIFSRVGCKGETAQLHVLH
jgi:hypothetical protein